MASDFLAQLKRVNAAIATQHLNDDDPDKQLPPVITDYRRQWMAKPEAERGWTVEALQFNADVMAGRYKRKRSGRISPSGIGEGCGRLVLFSYGGWPQTPFPMRNQDLMDQGSFLHLKWQMEGLTAGWMKQGEVWVHDPDFGPGVGGSADGQGFDDSLLEIKTTGAGPYMRYSRSPNPDHLLQMETYWEVDSRTTQQFEPIGSLIYVNRESGAFIEHRVRSDPQRREAVRRTVEDHQQRIDLDELPDMLEVCAKRSGSRYFECQYHATCPSAQSVWYAPEVEATR